MSGGIGQELTSSYVLEIEWSDNPRLPRLVGPFYARDAAVGWATLNVVNGDWNVAPITYPYYRTPTTSATNPTP